METPVEAQQLQLLETYLESLAAFRSRLDGAPPTPEGAANWRILTAKLAYLRAEEPADMRAAAQPAAVYEAAPLLAAVAAIGRFAREQVALPAWVLRTAPPPSLPPWAEGVATLVTALAALAAPLATPRHRKTRDTCRKGMARLTALSASDANLRGAAALVEAEMLCKGNLGEAAAQAYESACTQLARSRFIALHALALQYAANACRRAGLPMADAGFRKEAAQRYAGWGDALPHREARAALETAALTTSDSTHGASRHGSEKKGHFSRDLRAAIIAARALAGEGTSTRVAERIIDTLQVLVGAGRVVLVIEAQGELVAEVDTAGTLSQLPLRLLAYAIRSGDPVLLDDLAAKTFDDPYFATHKTGSLLCVPWRQTSVGSGAVLLENSVTPHAFSRERIDIVRFLATTAATASAHAHLRSNMEAGIALRIRAGNAAVEEAQAIRRSNSEMQMAGGFAHEMRNSLAATRFALSSLIARSPEDAAGVLDDDAALVERCRADLAASDGATSMLLVRGALDALQSSQQRLENTYDVIREGIDRGLHAAKVIMEFGRIANDKAGLAPTPLEPLVMACVSRWRQQPTAANTQWDVNIPPEFVLPVSDKHIEIVLDALLSNALDACADPSVDKPRIVIAASKSADALRLFIEDSGCGMSADTRHRAFEPFFSTKGAQNVGLGLTMARKIAHLYGGAAHLTSTVGQGAAVELRFDV